MCRCTPRHPVILMDSTDTKRIEFLTARRKRFRNLRFFIPLVGLYILYDGIRTIIREGTAPAFFYVFLAAFAGLMIFAFFQNERRIRDVESELTRLEAQEEAEGLIAQEESVSDENPENPDQA